MRERLLWETHGPVRDRLCGRTPKEKMTRVGCDILSFTAARDASLADFFIYLNKWGLKWVVIGRQLVDTAH